MIRRITQGNTVIREMDSITECIRYCNEEPINSSVFHRISSVHGEHSFTGTHSLDEAYALMEGGWEPGYKDLIDEMCTVKLHSDEENPERFKVLRKPYGASPNVPRHIMGHPDSMFHPKHNAAPARVISVYVNASANCSISPETLMTKGASVLKYIEHLERKGYRTNIYASESATEDNEAIVIAVKIKDSRENLNLKRVAFPLAHPSFLRRIIFRVDETCPVKKSGWDSGYGRPNDKPFLKYLNSIHTHLIYVPSADSVSPGRDPNKYINKVIEYNKENIAGFKEP